jgi:hypothetical protein
LYSRHVNVQGKLRNARSERSPVRRQRKGSEAPDGRSAGLRDHHRSAAVTGLASRAARRARGRPWRDLGPARATLPDRGGAGAGAKPAGAAPAGAQATRRRQRRPKADYYLSSRRLTPSCVKATISRTMVGAAPPRRTRRGALHDDEPGRTVTYRIDHVIDGNTVVLRNGRRCASSRSIRRRCSSERSATGHRQHPRSDGPRR